MAKDLNRPRRLMDTFGRKAKTRRRIETGQMSIPAGSLVTVRSSTVWSKMNVLGEPCSCCGVAVRVICGPEDLDFLPVDAAPVLPLGVGP